MALNSSTTTLLSLLLVLFFRAISKNALAGDPDITQDFIIPQNHPSVDANFFTFTGMPGVFDHNLGMFKVTKATMAEFPALNGQSVSLKVLQFPAGSVNSLHSHPHASEFLFLVNGILEVGFVDKKNVLYKQILKEGDMFVFPKGLVHYQYNRNRNDSATAISTYGSARAETVSVPESVFTTGIDVEILTNAFKTDVDTVKKIKEGITKPGN